MLRWLVVPAVLMLLAVPAGADPLRPDVARTLEMLDGFPAPSAWSGIWNHQITMYLCGSEIPMFTETSTDTTCTGDVLEFDEGQTCTGTFTATTVDIECEWTDQVLEGCTAQYRVTIDGSVSGNSSQQILVINVTYEGAGCDEELEDMCTRTVIAGTRTAPEPASCRTPAEPATWGAIKAQYR